jgi:2,4-dienoyl-CoA reductase (NADPH2)
VTKLGVKINLGEEFTPTLAEKVKPDVIVLATGGEYVIPEIPGINGTNVLTSAQLARRAKFPLRVFGPRFLRWLTKFYLPVGKTVVVLGGLLEGVETAELLVKRGRKVTIVETSDNLGEGMPTRLLKGLFHWLQQKEVVIFSGVKKYERITDKGITIVTKEGEIRNIKADSIVVAMPRRPSTKIFEALKGKGAPEVHLIGPPYEGKSWLIVDAIANGFHVGNII